MAIKFGGADKRSMSMLARFEHGFYISDLVGGANPKLAKYIERNYIKQGAALFGRETKEDLQDFRRAAGGLLKDVSDEEVSNILHFAVQRLRNYGHVLGLQAARLKFAKIDNFCGRNPETICGFLADKLLPIKGAAETVASFTELTPDEYAERVLLSESGQSYDADPLSHVKTRIDNNVIADSLVREGRIIPPFHWRCGCRLVGMIPGVNQ